MIVKCKSCGKEYELAEADNPDDFQCECGGDLKENVSLDAGVNFSEMESLVKSITNDDKAFEGKDTGTQVGKTKEIVKEKIEEYHYENIGNEEKNQIKNILKESIDNQKGIRWAITEMVKTIDGMTRERAESIARTVTVKTRNQAELVKGKKTGKEYFIVSSAKDCCDKCYNAYNGQVFSKKDDVDKLPPLHEKCRCSATFFRSKSLAKAVANDTSKPRK